MVCLGVDLGGTKTEVAALDGAGEIVFRERMDTPSGDYDATLDTIATLVELAEASVGVASSIGMAMPGSLSPATGRVRNSNSTCLNGRLLKNDLTARLGRDVAMANDANCLALSEATDGAGLGATTVFAAIVGTGTGAGLVVDGKVLVGANGIAGEWGHNPLPWPTADEWPGAECWCGLSGCIETWISGPGLAADYLRRGGEQADAKRVLGRFRQGDALAAAVWHDYVERMAKSLAQVINLFDPDVIVLGGGISRIDELYEAVPARWGKYIFNDDVATRLLPPVHGDSSGVRGAAWIGVQNVLERA